MDVCPNYSSNQMILYLISDTEQLRTGAIKVREILGDEVRVTDRAIEDSLWHYYYDVEKTVNYLLSEKISFTISFKKGSC